MMTLLSTSAPVRGTAGLLSALRLAHDLFRDHAQPMSDLPLTADDAGGLVVRIWEVAGTKQKVVELATALSSGVIDG